MLPRFVPLLLVAACASKGGEGARGQGEKEAALPPAPAGAVWRTARGASWEDVLEDLAAADVVFVSADDEGMRLAVLQYLFDRGRLHAIGLETFPRTAQAALDDFSFQRIDADELAKRCGAIAAADRPVLAFGRERRLPVLGLGVEREILDAVASGGLEALSEEQRRSLPAVRASTAAEFLPASQHGPIAIGLGWDVAVDVIVRWYRDAAPEGAQVAVFAWSARPRSLPERLLARSGRTYRTLAAVTGKPEAADPAVFARSYADYVWFMGAER